MTEKMTAAEAVQAAFRRNPQEAQCATCRALEAIDGADADVLMSALPDLGYRGLARAFGLMGHKVRSDSIKAHLEKEHPTP